jgi:hypothetical protein
MAPQTTPLPSKNATALQVLEGMDLQGKSVLITGGNQGIGILSFCTNRYKDIYDRI